MSVSKVAPEGQLWKIAFEAYFFGHKNNISGRYPSVKYIEPASKDCNCNILLRPPHICVIGRKRKTVSKVAPVYGI